MIGRLRELELRRSLLVARSDAQRAALAVAVIPLARPLVAFDRVVAAVRSHPVLAGLAVGGLALLGRNRLLAWAARAALALSVLRRG
jgi:hypothetical protein